MDSGTRRPASVAFSDWFEYCSLRPDVDVLMNEAGDTSYRKHVPRTGAPRGRLPLALNYPTTPLYQQRPGRSRHGCPHRHRRWLQDLSVAIQLRVIGSQPSIEVELLMPGDRHPFTANSLVRRRGPIRYHPAESQTHGDIGCCPQSQPRRCLCGTSVEQPADP